MTNSRNKGAAFERDVATPDWNAKTADFEDADILREATKFDGGKLPVELIAPEIIAELAKVLQFGANKYEARNWEKGMDWGRVYGALQRHLWVWWGGEAQDEETGFSHLSHAACCIMFLVAYEARGTGKDNRP